MVIKTYDSSDLRPYTYDAAYKFEFIADVAGDNPDIFEGDNHDVADKLKSLGAIGKGDELDEESGCFFIYFKTEEAGIAFLKKLSAYIRQKKNRIEKAKAF